jgi:EAL domain-containing protein (putative c-di-GMP-specific phosphodiesterase class I)
VVSRLARWIRSSLAIKPDWPIPRNNVNLSSATLIDPTFGEYVRLNVDESHLSEGALGLEISWDSASEHRDSLKRLMAELRPHGISFTVADYDGSESSFALLRDVAPDFVKLNLAGAYGANLSSNTERISAICRRCESLAIKTIVEGIEDDNVYAHMRQTSVNFAQGFAISAVLPL